MATNKMRPIHPGEILREEYLAPLGMSANALAMALHVPAPRVNDIVRELDPAVDEPVGAGRPRSGPVRAGDDLTANDSVW